MNPIEAFLTSMHGVVSAKVLHNDDGQLDQVYVLTDKNEARVPSQRDVQTALLTKFNLSISAEQVFIIRAHAKNWLGGADSINRFQLIGVTSGVLAERTFAKVCLRWQNELSVGLRRGYGSPRLKPRLIAEATIAAIDGAFGLPIGFKVIDVSSHLLGGQACIACLVAMSRGGKRLNLAGIALAEDNADFAVARSVLDAVNRNIDYYAIVQEIKEQRAVDSAMPS